MPKESYAVGLQIILVFWWLVQCSVHLLCCVLSRFSCVRLFATPMDCSLPGSSVHGFLQARNWSGLPCSPPRDLLHPGIEPASLTSPALAGGFFTTSPVIGVQGYEKMLFQFWMITRALEQDFLFPFSSQPPHLPTFCLISSPQGSLQDLLKNIDYILFLCCLKPIKALLLHLE